MKIVVTISDGTMAANIGGNVENRSVILHFSDECLPFLLKQFFEGRKSAKKYNRCTYDTISFSLLDEGK